MLKRVVLFLLVLSVVVGAECTCEVVEFNPDECDINDYGMECPDLIINGDFDTRDESHPNGQTLSNIKTLTLKSGSFTGGLSADVILEGSSRINISYGLTSPAYIEVKGDAYYESVDGGFSVNELNMTSGSFFPVGETILTVNSIYYSDGTVNFGGGKEISIPTLESPVSGMDFVRHIEGSDSFEVNIFSDVNENRLVSFDGDQWVVDDATVSNNYFSISNLGGNVWGVVSDEFVEKTLTNPIVTLTSPLAGQYNRTSVEFLYSVETNSTLTECKLYVNDTLDGTDTELTEHRFVLDDDLLDNEGYSWNVNCTDIFGNVSVSSGVEFFIVNDTESPSISLLADPDQAEITKGGEITITCTAIDNVDVSHVKIYTVDDVYCTGANSDGCSRKKTFLSTGEVEVFCNVWDHNLNNETTSLKFNVVEESSSPGSPGSSSPASSNDDNDEDDEKKETSPTGLVIAGSETGLLTFSIDDVGVKEILVTSDKNGDVEVKETELGNLTETGGIVYKYLEITSTISDDDIDGVEITFVVPVDWLDENYLTKDDIVLLRYSDGWKELTTQVVEERETEIEFKATCGGFSVFAVGTRWKIDFGLAVMVVGLGAVLVVGYVLFMRFRKQGVDLKPKINFDLKSKLNLSKLKNPKLKLPELNFKKKKESSKRLRVTVKKGPYD